MDTILSPVEPPGRKNPSRKFMWTILGAAIILAAGVAGAAVYTGHVLLPISSSGSVEGQPSTATIVAYFPNLSDIRGVAPDPTDKRLFWLFNYTGVVMQVNAETREVIDYSQRIHETDITDLVRVGDTLFIGLQGGGVSQYSLGTGTAKRYTENDGLASNNNIYITPDPADADVLWVGTFYGLNKLSISSGKIDRFQTEMGIPSTAPKTSLQPVVFHVDDHYVWVTISANAFTNGGVARLDKKTGAWKSWGYEKFAPASTRFDTYGAAADGERAVVEENRSIYSYSSTKDTWLPIVTATRSDPIKVSFSLKGTHAYYVAGDIPKELNIDTGIERNFLSPDILTGSSVSTNTFENMPSNMRLDQSGSRMILHPRPSGIGSSGDVIGILPLDGSTKAVVFPFTVLEEKFGATSVGLADANGDRILLSATDRLAEYDTAKGLSRTLLPYPVNAAEIAGNKIVALNLAQCDMGCSGNIAATSTILSLDTGTVDFVATLKNVETPMYYIGKSLDEVFLSGNNYATTTRGYKLNAANKSFDDVGTAFPHEFISNEYSKYSEKSSDGSYTMSFNPNDNKGDAVVLSVQHGSGSATTVTVPIAPALRTSPFSSVQDIQITNTAFDPSHANIVWVGTSRGLIWLNMSTFAYRTYTTNDGLSSNKINKVIATDNAVIVEHPSGVYVYRF